MPNIVLEIAENGRQLHLRRGSVAVMAGEECLGLVPVDSLACVLLAADGIMISRAFMARMAEEGVPVIEHHYQPHDAVGRNALRTFSSASHTTTSCACGTPSRTESAPPCAPALFHKNHAPFLQKASKGLSHLF